MYTCLFYLTTRGRLVICSILSNDTKLFFMSPHEIVSSFLYFIESQVVICSLLYIMESHEVILPFILVNLTRRELTYLSLMYDPFAASHFTFMSPQYFTQQEQNMSEIMQNLTQVMSIISNRYVYKRTNYFSFIYVDIYL